MSWSIVEVARHAGVSSRTLRHYDDVGLVPPAYVGSNGYRYYEQEQLLRLQEVLLLRELGVPLGAIRRVLDGTADRVAVLREHRVALLAERDRLDRLAATVARMVEMRERGDHMGPEELFEGFDADRQRGYEAELVERYGEDNAAYVWDTLHPEVREREIRFIETPETAGLGYADAMRERAAAEGKEFILIPGSTRLLRALVAGGWDESEFLVVPPGRRIEPAWDHDRVMDAV